MKQRGLPRCILEGVEGVVVFAAVLCSWPISRRWFDNWGATVEERKRTWPGDALVSPGFEAHTRGIAIAARPAVVWSWIVQIGLGRAGFYSYEILERLIGIPVTNIESIEPELQSLAGGDTILLHPKSPAIPVGLLQPQRYVCFGEKPSAESHPPRSWSFYVEPVARDACRLVLRGCVEPPARGASLRTRFAAALDPPVDFVMEQRMLRTVKRLAESSAPIWGDS